MGFITPKLEYTCVCFDNISIHQVNQLEHIQLGAALVCTHAYQKTPNRASLNELGWPTLQQRRYDHKLVVFYKMDSGSVPNYLQVLIPPTKGILAPRYATRSWLPTIFCHWKNINIWIEGSSPFHSLCILVNTENQDANTNPTKILLYGHPYLSLELSISLSSTNIYYIK